MLTSVRTCTPTPSCLVAPPCTQVLLTECKRRSLLHLRGNTPYGLEDPSWLPFPPSNRCGSPNKNTTNAAHPLSTENASKCYHRFVTHLMSNIFCKRKCMCFDLEHSKIKNFKISWLFVKFKIKFTFEMK